MIEGVCYDGRRKEHRKGYTMADLKYLNRLSRDYPNIKAASAEIINLKAILALPKGTEYFLSDLHGEHEAFIHMLKSASGTIKMKTVSYTHLTLPTNVNV